MEFSLPALMHVKTMRGDDVQGMSRLSGAAQMGRMIFCCPDSGREFDSGFRSTAEELGRIPADYKMNVMCSICYRFHPVTVSQARISDEPAGPAS
jgi:hypothetical protein